MNDKRDVKVCLLGDANVGKTSLSLSLKHGKCSSVTFSTVGAAFLKVTSDKDYNLCVWDTAGGERFQGLMPMYVRGSEVVVCVYDITNEQSFRHVCGQIHKFKKKIDGCENAIWFLVGSKADLFEVAQVNHQTIDDLKRDCNVDNVTNIFVSNMSGEGVSILKQKIYESIRTKDDTLPKGDDTVETKKDVINLSQPNNTGLKKILCCNN